VQAALGKADARDTFEGQRTKLANALSDFESISNQRLKAAAFESGKVWDELVERAKTLESEVEALKSRIWADAAKHQAALESKMQELLAKLPAYKDKMKEKRQEIEAKATTFEADLRTGLDQIKSGFKRLFE
jgi:predicted nuclease with TOPRIM domain